MFKELMADVYVDGVITRDWCEVPIQKWHVLQVSISPTPYEKLLVLKYLVQRLILNCW
jgi:hypothetical protein